jgi:hypothetical protein
VVRAHTVGPVLLRVNGAPAEYVTPEFIVPPKLLERGSNWLRFEPFDAKEWTVSDLKVEVVPLPSAEREPLLAAATNRMDEATGLMRSEQVDGPYRALRVLREAKVMLAVAPGARPAAWTTVGELLRTVDLRLGQTCNDLLDEARTADAMAAKVRLEALADMFPGYDHWCRAEGEKLRAERGL